MAVLAQFQTIVTNLETIVTDIQNGTIVIGAAGEVSQQDVTDSATAVTTAVGNVYTALGQTPPTPPAS